MARYGHPDYGSVEQEIRFCELDGRRIAYATVGEGPTLLFGGRWVTLVFFGSYASRSDVPEATRRSIVDFVRTNWPLAAQMLAGLILPKADGSAIEAMSRYQRHSASAEVAGAFLELDLTADARGYLPSVETPTLVLHRRGDRTVPISHGREVARLLPNARFVALDGVVDALERLRRGEGVRTVLVLDPEAAGVEAQG